MSKVVLRVAASVNFCATMITDYSKNILTLYLRFTAQRQSHNLVAIPSDTAHIFQERYCKKIMHISFVQFCHFCRHINTIFTISLIQKRGDGNCIYIYIYIYISRIIFCLHSSVDIQKKTYFKN